MVPFFPVILLTIVYVVTEYSSASSHWVVTEEGKIQSQMDSIFSMKRPYDLVSFMQQEERAAILTSLKDEMSSQKFDETVSHVFEQTSATQNEVELQQRFFETNVNCKKAKIPLTEFDLYVSTLIQPDVDVDVIIRRYYEKSRDSDEDDDYDYEDDDEKPYCSNLESVTDIARFVNQLSVYTNRHNLKMNPDEAIASTLSLNKPSKLARFSKAIRNYLNKNKQNWVANFYAACYWRIAGNIQEALQCLRNAVVAAPEPSKHVGLLGLANICHRAHHSHEAVALLQKAIQLSPEQATLHFTLGNVYATVMQFNESAESYQRAINIKPKYHAAKARKYSVLCHENLERMLQKQHHTLQETLEELRQYKKQHDAWAALLTKILNEQASSETRVEIQRSYDRMKVLLNSKMDNRFQNSIKVGKAFAREADRKAAIDRLLKVFEQKIEESGILVEQMDQKSTTLSTDDAQAMDDLIVPTLRAKYQSWPLKKVTLELPDPTVEECSSILTSPLTPKWDDFPTVFVSPENRGFDVAELFSVHVDIPSEHAAALPWFPPLCKPYNRPIPKYDRMKSFEKIRRSDIEVRSTAEKGIEIEYSMHSPVKSFHEWGARINAALKKKTPIPEWITHLLAGTYWRIWGHPQNGLECYKHAIAKAPEKYLDIVLTNLAGLLYKAGSVGDAITVLKDAVTLNDKEPGSNFFLANLLNIKGNYTGSIHHYSQVLKMEPEHSEAIKLVQIPVCQSKLNLLTKLNQDDSCANELSAECLNRNSLTRVPGLDAMIYCKGGQCKFVDPNEIDPNDNNLLEPTMMVPSTETEMYKKGSLKKKKKGSKKIPSVTPSPQSDYFDDLGEGTTTTLLMARDEIKNGLPQGAVEIGTIAETDSDEEEVDQESRLVSRMETSIGPVYLRDDPLPDVLVAIRPDPKLFPELLNYKVCDEDEEHKSVNWQAFTSTWLSVSAKGIDIREYLGDYLEPLLAEDGHQRPICLPEVPTSLLTFDHLTGVKNRHRLHLASEAGLKEAFSGLIISGDLASLPPMEESATRIAVALAANETSWVLSTAAALYWRVKGNSEQALQCLRHSLFYAPRDMRDIPLISMANVFHRAGLYNDALIVANQALEISPKFVVVHFTLANIYASMGDYETAAKFYMSTLDLQATFNPAKDRLFSLHCNKKLLPIIPHQDSQSKDEL